jgi:hypothetical protein
MTRLKTTVTAALAFAIMFAGTAAAQTVPTLTATVGAPDGIGAVVTLNWTPVPGAEGYTFQAGVDPVTPLVHYNVPGGSSTQGTVFAPNGTYYIRVRAYAGALVGEYSPVQTVTVGGACVPPSPPAITATPTGGTVSVNWSPIAGAVGYRVEFGLTPTSTDLVQTVGPGTTSLNQYAGILGTFFVRVTTGNACGMATSATVPFTIETLAGSGPRTPDPPPGQLIPRETLSYAPAIVQQLAREYWHDLQNSCTSYPGGNNMFMFRVLQRLRQIDSRWGLNYKRGRYGDLSQDVVAYNPTNRPDLRPDGTGEDQVYLFDIIFRHCGTGSQYPDWAWFDITNETWHAGSACGGTPHCAMWGIEPYLRAGFPADGRQ